MLCQIDYSVLNRGSTQPLITQKDVENYPVPKIEKARLSEFETNVSCIMGLVDHNRKESRHLAQLRDTLLPKLMDGTLKPKT